MSTTAGFDRLLETDLSLRMAGVMAGSWRKSGEAIIRLASRGKVMLCGQAFESGSKLPHSTAAPSRSRQLTLECGGLPPLPHPASSPSPANRVLSHLRSKNTSTLFGMNAPSNRLQPTSLPPRLPHSSRAAAEPGRSALNAA
jgi:hypothetical protein